MFALRGAFGLVGIRVFGEHGHIACHRQQGSTAHLGGVRRDMFDPSARADSLLPWLSLSRVPHPPHPCG
jgi:hypothetical protein